MRYGIPKQEGAYNPAFARLPTPSGGEKLGFLEQFDELFLVMCGFESHDLAEKLDWLPA
jgi:hypothetical protein